jgi:Aldo/keto reductase family
VPLEDLTFIVDFHRDDSVLEFLQVRQILESAAAEMAAKRIGEPETENLSSLLDGLSPETSVDQLVEARRGGPGVPPADLGVLRKLRVVPPAGDAVRADDAGAGVARPDGGRCGEADAGRAPRAWMRSRHTTQGPPGRERPSTSPAASIGSPRHCEGCDGHYDGSAGRACGVGTVPVNRRCTGRSGVQVTEPGFGGAPVGNLYSAVDEATAAEAVGAAWDVGVWCFDTAAHYGLGLSERWLKNALASWPRSEFAISMLEDR